MTEEQWWQLSVKADWEGGWPSLILEYGLPAFAQEDPAFSSAANLVHDAWNSMELIIEKYIAKYGEYA